MVCLAFAKANIKFIKAVSTLSLYCHQETRVNMTHIYTLLRVHCKYKFIVIKMLLSRLSAMDIGHQAKLHELLCSFFLKLLCYHFLLFHSFSIYNKHHSLLFFRFQKKTLGKKSDHEDAQTNWIFFSTVAGLTHLHCNIMM